MQFGCICLQIEVPNRGTVTVQILTNEYNGDRIHWYGLHGLHRETMQLENAALQRVYGQIYNGQDTKGEPQFAVDENKIGIEYQNKRYTILFDHYSYKVNVHKIVKKKMSDAMGDDFELFQLDKPEDTPEFRAFKAAVTEMTAAINETMECMVEQDRRFEICRGIKSSYNGLWASLLYKIKQAAHCDTFKMTFSGSLQTYLVHLY